MKIDAIHTESMAKIKDVPILVFCWCVDIVFADIADSR